MTNTWKDLRYAVRMLSNKPAFTLAAVLVLALGIGANASVFNLVSVLLLKPLRIDKPEEIVGVYSRDTKKPDSYRAFSYPNYADLRASNPVFSSLLAHTLSMVGIEEGDTTRRAFADIISSNYFGGYGVPLLQGRAFTVEEERPDSEAPVAIVSYRFWTKHGSDPTFIGKTVRVNGRTLSVVGIAPEGFTGSTSMISPEVYLPLGLYDVATNDFHGENRGIALRGNHNLILVGRLKPGVSFTEADAKLSVVAAQMEKAFPAENRDQTLVVRKLSRNSVSTNPSDESALLAPVILLIGMGGVVLLIASLNLANLMLARGTARRKEISIRLAIGATRWQIVRQLFTEGLVLSLLGGVAAVGVASWSTAALVRSLGSIMPIDIVVDTSVDFRVLAATFACCLFSTIVFGLWPAWKLSKPDVVSDLKESAGEDSSAQSRRIFSRRNALVIAQISLSLAMLASAGLFVRSAIRASQIEPGFRLESGIIAEVDPSLVGIDETRGRQLYSALQSRLSTIPGVESVAFAATVPFGMVTRGEAIRRAGDAQGKDGPAPVSTNFNVVSDSYFATLGIPMLRGRTFRPTEMLSSRNPNALDAVVLDKISADRLWPNQDPIGKHIQIAARGDAPPNAPRKELEVVGIAGTVQSSIFGNKAEAHMYVPFGRTYQSNMQIHLKVAARSADAEMRLADTVRREIRAVDQRLPLLTLKTMRSHLAASVELWTVRTGARILGIFGGVAMLLAVIGLYGIKAYTVARRTREIGVRMALGATSEETMRMILLEGFQLTLVGVGIGLLLALGLGKLLSGFLYQGSAADPLVLLLSPLALTATSLIACYIPARRAGRVDPIVALRYE